MHPVRLGCVIMASGLGRRFGTNKLLADFGGMPLICRVLKATESLFDKRIVVTRYEDVAALCKQQQTDVLLHQYPFRSDTVRLGLQAIAPTLDGCLFCPADQPLLSKNTLTKLLNAAAQEPAAIWRPECGGTPASPVIFPAWAFPELLTLPEDKGGGYLIKKYPDQVRTVRVDDPYELMDVDTPNDLRRLLFRENLD